MVDLPGGGGKRLATSYQTYNRNTGKSTFVAPAVKGGEKIYEYWDPLASLPQSGVEEQKLQATSVPKLDVVHEDWRVGGRAAVMAVS